MFKPKGSNSMTPARRIMVCVLVAFACLGGAAERARAAVVFNSYGPSNAVDTSINNLLISGGIQAALAVRFVPGSPSDVASVMAALKSTGGNNQSSLIVTLHTDSGGQPAASAIWTSNPVIVSILMSAMTTCGPIASSCSIAFGAELKGNT